MCDQYGHQVIRAALMPILCCIVTLCSFGLEKTARAQTLYGVSFDNSSIIYRIDNFATAPAAIPVSFTGIPFLTDVAIDPVTRQAYAISMEILYEVDFDTGGVSAVGPFGSAASGAGLNSLDIALDGTMYAAGNPTTFLFEINKSTGQASPLFDTGRRFRGDIAYDPLTDSLFGAALSGSQTRLVQILPATSQVVDIGPNGVSFPGFEIAEDGTMYGAEADLLYEVSRQTGASTLIGNTGAQTGVGLALATGSAAGPRVICRSPSSPGDVFADNQGISQCKIVFSERVGFDINAVSVTSDSQMVPIDGIAGDGSTVMLLNFSSAPLQEATYTVVLHDSIQAVTTGAALDGDADGVAGGDYVFTLTHTSRDADLDSDGDVDIDDFGEFQQQFTGPLP